MLTTANAKGEKPQKQDEEHSPADAKETRREGMSRQQ